MSLWILVRWNLEKSSNKLILKIKETLWGDKESEWVLVLFCQLGIQTLVAMFTNLYCVILKFGMEVFVLFVK